MGDLNGGDSYVVYSNGGDSNVVYSKGGDSNGGDSTAGDSNTGEPTKEIPTQEIPTRDMRTPRSSLGSTHHAEAFRLCKSFSVDITRIPAIVTEARKR